MENWKESHWQLQNNKNIEYKVAPEKTTFDMEIIINFGCVIGF